MRISDWSSDVCSSDLTAQSSVAVGTGAQATGLNPTAVGDNAVASGAHAVAIGNEATATADTSVALGNGVRKSVVSGKSVSVRVDLGGSRISKTHNETNSKPDAQHNER